MFGKSSKPAVKVSPNKRVLTAQVWAIKSYTKTPLYVQVLKRAAAHTIAPFLSPDRDVVVSTEQTRHRLLALSCLCPGASTLIGWPKFPTQKLMVHFLGVYGSRGAFPWGVWQQLQIAMWQPHSGGALHAQGLLSNNPGFQVKGWA